MRITSPIILAALLLAGCAAGSQRGPTVDIEMQRLMVAAKVPGLALAVIDHGQVVSRHAYGYADVAAARPLRTDSIMYGASLTKAAFAYMVMQLVDERVLTLDAPLSTLLDKPLPGYPAFADLRDDPRWRLLTPRMLLSHTSGLLNWRFINENRKLDFKYPPGSRYVYSGEGMQILHKRRSRARAAGSMDTTLDDYASFMAGVLRGDGLSAAARAEMLSPQMAIVSPQQFPSH
ncbi:serine hydrolase [Rugamonas sp. FT82W]|uniref:Serine hydrolase n=1 Tax=Duganella vulcania TaxID=2692166 RepID=A0A845GB74_9BURK|nr:serine hydrolase domain-containing protein [Duganella vulcania]MYM90098.1 serine hydrolase [Duganella vulcania]